MGRAGAVSVGGCRRGGRGLGRFGSGWCRGGGGVQEHHRCRSESARNWRLPPRNLQIARREVLGRF